MAITNWGYKRENWQRTSREYTSFPTSWNNGTHSDAAGEYLCESTYVGAHGLTQTQSVSHYEGGVYYYVATQRCTYDIPFIVFDLPSQAVQSAGLRIYIEPQSKVQTITIKRNTSGVGTNAAPSTTNTHSVTLTANKVGGWYDVDISDMVNDAIAAGASSWYGISLWNEAKFDSAKCMVSFTAIELTGEIATGAARGAVVVDGTAHNIVSEKACIAGAWHDVTTSKICIGGEWR